MTLIPKPSKKKGQLQNTAVSLKKITVYLLAYNVKMVAEIFNKFLLYLECSDLKYRINE